MGCDIHVFLERKNKDGKYELVKELDGTASVRNYRLFAALAGVRGEGPEPKGLPADVSEAVREIRHDWGGDGHSDSWEPFEKAVELWEAHRYGDFPLVEFFEHGPPEPDDRLVFWFDN